MQFKRVFESPFYIYLKKHYCVICGERLKLVLVSKIVNSESMEAKNYDFQLVDNFMIGDVKFTWNEFECPKCGYRISIRKLKERDKRK